MEVADLEDDVAGLETRIQKIKNELDDSEDDIVTRKNLIKDAQANIKKYETQLGEVKNNREYDAISKEIEIQGLDIQVSEKKIREFGYDITTKTQVYDKALAELEARKADLDAKRDELDTISSETEKEEGELSALAEKASKHIEERLLIAYNRLRKKCKEWPGCELPSNVTAARAALTRSRHSASRTSASAKRSLFANIAAAS